MRRITSAFSRRTVPALFAACLFMMMGLLMLWRIAEETFFSGDSPSRR